MNKKSLIIILVTGIAAVVVYLSVSGSAESETATAAIIDDPEIELLKAEVAELQRVKDLPLDTSVFENPIFLELKPPPLSPPSGKTPGRENPFVRF